MNHQFESALELATPTWEPLPPEFFQRASDFYRRLQANPAPMSAIWADNTFQFHLALHELLLSGDLNGISQALANIYHGCLLYGMDYGEINHEPGHLEEYIRRWTLACLNLSHCLSVLPVVNPEQPATRVLRLDELIPACERELGFSLAHPGGAGLYGVALGTKIIPLKLLEVCLFLTSARRLLERPPKVLIELGAGTGMVGYAARRMFPSLVSYHTVDLPIASVLQACLLAHAEGPERVWLAGEAPHPAQRIHIHGHHWPEGTGPDVICNQDSLPEMPSPAQNSYLGNIAKELQKWRGLFISVNHESPLAGQIRVFAAAQAFPSMRLISRSPYWGRPGYVEEVWR